MDPEAAAWRLVVPAYQPHDDKNHYLKPHKFHVICAQCVHSEVECGVCVGVSSLGEAEDVVSPCCRALVGGGCVFC